MSTYASRCTDGDDYGGGGGGGFMQGELATISSKYAHLKRSTCINRLTSVPPRGSISNPTEFLGIGTQNSNTPGGTGRVDQALRPVTIKQVLMPKPQTPTRQFRSKISMSLMNATNVLLQVGDGTGESKPESGSIRAMGRAKGSRLRREFSFVKPIDHLRSRSKTVAGLRVEKITDFNEINYRLLDAVRVTLAYERGATGAGDEMNIDQSTNHTTHGKIIQAKTPTELLIRIRSWSIFLAFNLLMRALTSTTLRGSAIWT
ncbi:replication factor A protein 2 [Puccinia graminis f. sp. tritici]|uniref:Replication factor A protein 2 n=1 Tax=Puccinia graminis f. sp. tritici TaxID=56615 RepID=A0A5B0N2W4_PUCGR|nr:replication factor A protein 2 [Puccinia graminis f. sp. tritici]